MSARALLVASLAALACAGCPGRDEGDAGLDASSPDTSQLDAPTLDAPQLDAPSLDALALDAPPDGGPDACPRATTLCGEICADLEARRDRWGISYYVLQGEETMRAMAPVVARLAGT